MRDEEYDVLSLRYFKFEGPKVQPCKDVKARDLLVTQILVLLIALR